MTDQREKGRGKRRDGDNIRARAAEEEPGYKVGYCRPPKEHQFQPGQSGNPKGRQKGNTELECQRDMRATFMKAATVPVTTMVDGKRTKIPALEAMYLKLIAKALDGHGPSMRFAHKLAHEIMEEHEKWQVIFAEHASNLIENLDNQPEDKKDGETIRLLNEAMKRVNSKPTDKS